MVGDTLSIVGKSAVFIPWHFVLISMRVSADIDECAASAYCPANSTCSNQPGSFECFCDLGYIMQNSLCVGECVPLPHFHCGL